MLREIHAAARARLRRRRRRTPDRREARGKNGQPVVVENRPGGDGFVAINAFTSARDDHVLLFGAGVVLHRASVPARQAAVRSARPSRRWRVSREHSFRSVVVPAVAQCEIDRRRSGHGAGAARQVQLGDDHGRDRLGARRLSEVAWNIDMAKVPYRDPVQALNDVG